MHQGILAQAFLLLINFSNSSGIRSAIKILYEFFSYVACALFILVTIDIIIKRFKGKQGIDRQWRVNLLLLAISQWELSQHFLECLRYPKRIEDRITESLWMASQTLVAEVILVSTYKVLGKPIPPPFWRWYKLDYHDWPGFDWILLIPLEVIAVFGTYMEIKAAEFAWGVFHVAIAWNVILKIHKVDKQKVLKLPMNLENALQDPDAKNTCSEKLAKESELITVETQPKGRHFITFCTLLLLAEGVLQTTFFGFGRLLPKLSPDYDIAADAVAALNFCIEETLGIVLPIILMIPEVKDTIVQYMYT